MKTETARNLLLTVKAINSAAKELFGVNTLLSSPESNPKVKKNGKDGVLTFPLHLLPGILSAFEVCQYRTPICSKACLHTAGNPLYMDGKELARYNRNMLFFKARNLFFDLLVVEIARAYAKATSLGMLLGIRLNATSDLPWERMAFTVSKSVADLVARRYGLKIAPGTYSSIMEAFPMAEFYDYTKNPGRLDLPANYSLTYSLAEGGDATGRRMIENGRNVAVVFNCTPGNLPEFFNLDGLVVRVHDGDKTDWRPGDPTPRVIGLTAKGSARGQVNGFVRAPDYSLTVA